MAVAGILFQQVAVDVGQGKHAGRAACHTDIRRMRGVCPVRLYDAAFVLLPQGIDEYIGIFRIVQSAKLKVADRV